MGLASEHHRSEIAFFDVETTVPKRTGQGFAILEFGAILVCPRKLVELHSYSTLVRPADLSLISSLSVRCNGITGDVVVSAPTFADIADKVYDILHGRIWAGHNILRFDCARIREAFAGICRSPPEPKGTIDSLALLTERFGRRAGDMKMATLATYFGLGQQTHRSLDDVRMNLEVLKYCATVLFLESSLPDIFTENHWISPSQTTRSHSAGKLSHEGVNTNMNTPSSDFKLENVQNSSPTDDRVGERHPISFHLTSCSEEVDSNTVAPNTAQSDPFDMSLLGNGMNTDILLPDTTVEENANSHNFQVSSMEGCSGYAGFLDPDEVSFSEIHVSLVPFYSGSQKIRLSYKNANLQLYSNLKVRFGISSKFVDHAGRPRLSFVVDIPPNLCKVLDACDGIAQKLSTDSGSSSEWRPVVTRKNGFFNHPTARLQIPTIVKGDMAHFATEIYQKDASGTLQKLVFSEFDAEEDKNLLNPGIIVDAFFSLDPYDYQLNAGIRLVAKKLIIHS